MNQKSFLQVILVVLVSGSCSLLSANTTGAQSIDFVADFSLPQSDIVFNEISPVISEGVKLKKHDINETGTIGQNPSIVFSLDSNKTVLKRMQASGCSVLPAVRKEGFSIRKSFVNNHEMIWVIARDTGGLLYGGFELAEQIRLHGLENIREENQNPYMAMRGIKFNIPLDARTPTYSEFGDAAQSSMLSMWDFDFWKTYIDHIARHRYNFISLWSLHPFPSMVKVPEYPDVALDDVMQAAGTEKKLYELSGRDYDSAEIMNNLQVIRKMTIDEKIAHWRKVMAYARDRNIDFYILTWNIFTYGTMGKYGITQDIKNEVTIDYFRKSVREMFLTYPCLAGIGLTTGENMPDATSLEKEDWAFQTYGLGVLDAAGQLPDREITLIHRTHETSAENTAGIFQPVIDHQNVTFLFSFKYAQAHSYSATVQPFGDHFTKILEKSSALQTIWTLRNDDNYYFSWGAPDFLRDFIRGIPRDISRGYYFGSDGYVWGRDFVSIYPEKENQLDIEKHWYSWMLWGRLGYNPDLGNDVFIALIQDRYPGAPAERLFKAWQAASMTYPLTTGFHWENFDFQWYIEACRSVRFVAKTFSGFHDINRFITCGTHPGTGNMTIPDYVESVISGNKPGGITPFEVSSQLNACADTALAIADNMRCAGHFELWKQLEDIRAMACLGKYYAAKINAATELALFRKTCNPESRVNCIAQLQRAACYWRKYVSIATSLYHQPQWFNRLGVVDLRSAYCDVIHDLISVGGDVDIEDFAPTSGGRIYEAETARSDNHHIAAKVAGYTGDGYINFSKYAYGKKFVEWKIDAPGTGLYLLEIRYCHLNGCDVNIPTILLNEKTMDGIPLWGTGSDQTWCSDKFYLHLEKGTSYLRLLPNGEFLIDHLNVVPLKNL